MARKKISRRDFVSDAGKLALGAVIAPQFPTIVPRHVLGGPGYRAPSDMINFAVVGLGGMGSSNAQELCKTEQLVAVCDVDLAFAQTNVTNKQRPNRDGVIPPQGIKLKEQFDKAAKYTDFREMLAKQKDIDGIVVATPDHNHAVVAKAAMDLGKHVYVQKPLTWSVHEARLLRKTAMANPKLVTQMGNQGHSSDGARLINEWIQAGVIGPVREVYVWTNRPLGYWPQGIPRPGKPPAPADASASQANGSGSGPAAGPAPQTATVNQFGTDWDARLVNKALAAAMDGDYPTPAGLEWDLFLGPGPEVAYHPIYHPFNWRGWLDWGTGAIGDMAAHLIDHPYWALGLTYPTSVEATFTPWGVDIKNNKVSYPMGTHIVYKFPARGAQPPVKLTWMDGGLMPGRPDLLPEDVPLDPGGGVIFIGDKG